MTFFAADIDRARGLIVLRALADTDERLAAELARSGAALASEAGMSRFLVDLRGTRNVASAFADYELAYRGFGLSGLDRRARIALLVDADDDSRDFFETLASNAGYSVRVLRAEAAALEWLRGA